MKRFLTIFCLPLFIASSLAHAGEIKAGAARISITPTTPMWLNGYAGREAPATESIHEIWAKALVIEENKNSSVIFVTTDLLGLSHEVVEAVYRALSAKYGINRSQLSMNASHTHSGPVVWPCLDVIHDFNVTDQGTVATYSHTLTNNIIKVVADAMSKLVPAKLYSGHGSAGFAINRRNLRDHNNNGSTDHDVPVLKVATPGGKILAVLFGYACHNTTLVDDNHLFNGDYAGFAQIEIEKNNPGAVALFLMGCGGDQNPEPRGTVALATKYGKELADAVQTAMTGTMKTVNTPVRTSYVNTDLNFQAFDLAMYQKDITGDNKYFQRRAKLMLEAYNKGWDVSKFHYPVQAVRFGNDLTILALSGEVVVDYSLKSKKIFAGENLFVAGYCNEVTCYIPSKRVLKEGGYEADESMVYYGLPGPFADDVEDRIFKAIRQVLQNTGVKVEINK
ncbi:MAG: Alkaline ceramidase domain protein [Ferruginibacter sp.]|uniref:neutral/alkaline non-lysosomal ceramidase N-terminal domain-containing protein n=1 Tax=Ferruginibacter sp. TaxID=1940288 RepID=UPI00265B5581|nr:neutral/alkaline non-lysosomal ceramidase N-terminal domain-containing protein [Ferruginibacter sp.]MDB5278807.1 Alkaline ceramidase domain protein [Ferruginibacter sp.]